jgi:hypothetical protein
MNIVEDNIKIYRSAGSDETNDYRELRELEIHRDQLIAIVNRKMQKILDNQSIS